MQKTSRFVRWSYRLACLEVFTGVGVLGGLKTPLWVPEVIESSTAYMRTERVNNQCAQANDMQVKNSQ
jgi:hypothetical protein